VVIPAAGLGSRFASERLNIPKEMPDRVGAHTLGAVMNKVSASAGSHAYMNGYYATTPAGVQGETEHELSYTRTV
jgi:UTP-glucose-1-phosphate uridylyltransferase